VLYGVEVDPDGPVCSNFSPKKLKISKAKGINQNTTFKEHPPINPAYSNPHQTLHKHNRHRFHGHHNSRRWF
jgi:hypothetical protein